MSILLVCSVKELKDILKLKPILRGNSDVPISNWSVKRSGYKTDSKESLETGCTHSILKQMKSETADPVPVVSNCPWALPPRAAQVANASVEIQRPTV